MSETSLTVLPIQAEAICGLLQPLGNKPMIITVRGDRDGKPRVLLEFELAEEDEVPDQTVLPELTAIFAPLIALREGWRVSGFALYFDPQYPSAGDITLDLGDLLSLVRNLAVVGKLLNYIPGRRTSAKPSARIGLVLEAGAVLATCNVLNAKGDAAVINEDSQELYLALKEISERLFNTSPALLSLSTLSIGLDIPSDNDEISHAAAEWLGSELCPTDLRNLVQKKYIGPFSDLDLLGALERAIPASNDDALLFAACQRFAGFIGQTSDARAAPNGHGGWLSTPGSNDNWNELLGIAEGEEANPAKKLFGKLWSKLKS